MATARTPAEGAAGDTADPGENGSQEEATDDAAASPRHDEKDNQGKEDGKKKPRRVWMLPNLPVPRHQNIQAEFGGGKPFVVQGDTLAVEMFMDKSLHEGQILHFVYIVERFLLQFTERGANIHLVFFEDFCHVLDRTSGLMLLARECLRLHMVNNAPQDRIQVWTFPNPWHQDWTDFITHHAISFVVVGDGLPLERNRKKYKDLLLGMELQGIWFTAQQISSTMIGGVDVKSNQIWGFHTVAGDFYGARIKRGIKTITHYSKVIFGKGPAPPDNYLRYMQVQALKCRDLCRQDDIPLRLAVAGAACKIALIRLNKRVPLCLDVCRVYLLHVALLEELPLSSRAHNVHQKELSESVMTVLSAICRGTKDILREFEQHVGDAEFFRRASFADIMDLRLVIKLSLLLDENFTVDGKATIPAECLSSAVVQRYTKLWEKFFTNQQEGTTEAFPITVGKPSEMLMDKDTKGHTEEGATDSDTDEDIDASVDDQEVAAPEKSLLPMQCPLVDEFVGDITQKLPTTEMVYSRKGDTITEEKDYDEDYHWHSGKPLEELGNDFKEERLSDDPWQRKWQIKQKQKFASYNRWYGESLEGNLYKAETIIVENRSETKQKSAAGRSKNNSNAGSTGKSKAPKKLAKSEQIKRDNIAKKEAEEAKKEHERWQNLHDKCKIMERDGEHSSLLTRIDSYLESCQSRSGEKCGIMYKVKILWLLWKENCKPGKERTDMSFVVELVTQVHLLLSKYETELTPDDKKSLADYMARLGFKDDGLKIYPALRDKERSEKYFVGMSSIRFQLTQLGHHLQREERTDPDHRVSNFIPDTWQRKLLDVVDNNQSALIIAPTSSGKTFASYYCIEKVLRESDDGVVVYVAPTKALVNQVAAVVYARFHQKKMPDGRSVMGTFTRDYRNNALTCQVLVTVPQAFEILMMSPKRQDWVAKIRYVIFDEIHCLGSEIGAEVWEHLLMLIRCPFLALSATISNPEYLLGWLRRAANMRNEQDSEENATGTESGSRGKKKGKTMPDRSGRKAYEVKLVVYSERYSDLVKHNCVPEPCEIQSEDVRDEVASTPDVEDAKSTSEDDSASGSDGSDDEIDDDSHHDATKNNMPKPRKLPKPRKQKFVQFHPIGTLSKQQLLSLETLPGDMSMSVMECVQLYDAMAKTGTVSDTLQRLQPEVYFGTHIGDRVAITRNEVREYEKELKRILVEWVNNENMTEEVNSVLQCLKPTDDSTSSDGDIENRESNVYLMRNIMSLLKSMNEQEKLPCLIFSFNRVLCQNLVKMVTLELEKEEEKLRTSELLQPMFKAAVDYRKHLEKIGKQIRDKVDTLKPGNKAILGANIQQNILMPFVVDYRKAMTQCLGIHGGQKRNRLLVPNVRNLNKPLPNCTFASEGQITDEEWLKVRERIGLPEEDIFVRGLKRGIAYHHAGLNAKKRVAIEILFRKKFLKVVIATGTLALGVHMPCRSVIFAGDSPYLTPIQYRQMSGRAGRRGYDIKGDIYFFGIPEVRIRQLMSSGLPKIQGNFPVTATCILRLILLCSTSVEPTEAVKKTLVLLQNPLMCYNKPQLMSQVKHHFLFCVQFLMRQGLLNEKGVPQGLAGLVTHLHYHEPANFVLVYFLRQGLFHQLCIPKKDGTFSEEVMRTMVLVLANLFGRSFLHKNFVKGIKPKSSVVKLPPLPKNFSKALKAYNQQVGQTFDHYLETVSEYVDQQNGGHGTALPVSGVDFRKPTQGMPSLASQVSAEAYHYKVCSSFAALSGNGDSGALLNNMLNNIPCDVYCESDVLPILEEKVHDRVGNKITLNAYALDFFKHGSSEIIVSDNFIMQGDVFKTLQDFLMVIQSVAVSVQQLAKESEADNVVRAFMQLRNEYYTQFKKNFDWDKLF